MAHALIKQDEVIGILDNDVSTEVQASIIRTESDRAIYIGDLDVKPGDKFDLDTQAFTRPDGKQVGFKMTPVLALQQRLYASEAAILAIMEAM